MVLLMLASCAPKGPDELVIACVGDSLMRPIPLHLKKSIRAIERRVVIVEWARGGLTVRSYLDFYERRFHYGRMRRPDFILIQLGTNDARGLIVGDLKLEEFKLNLREIIGEFKSYSNGRGGPTQVLVANVPLWNGEKYRQINNFVQDALNPSIESLAAEENVYLVDNYRILNKRPHLYSSDGIHPNEIGERALAQNWLIAIRKAARISMAN